MEIAEMRHSVSVYQRMLYNIFRLETKGAPYRVPPSTFQPCGAYRRSESYVVTHQRLKGNAQE